MSAASPASAPRAGLRGLVACCLGLALGATAAFAAPAAVPPATLAWGAVSQADLESRAAAADTNAEALVLADVGRFEFTHDDYNSFFHTRRVKILKESAYDKWGTVSVYYFNTRGAQSVEGLRAHTLVQNPDGTIKSIDLPGKDIFDEKVRQGLRRKKFTLPGLAPGCIVEYEYEVRSAFMAPPAWQFQLSEPVRLSLFSATVPSNSRLLLWKRGDHAGVREARVERAWPTTMWDTDRAARYGLKLFEYRWGASDVPALRAEPYLTTLDDYLTSLQVIFDGFEWGEALPVDNTDSWAKEGKRLTDAESFGGAIHLGPAGKERVKLLVRDVADSTARIHALYDFVRREIRTGGDGGIFAAPAQETFDARSGSVADVNMLFIALLRQAGFRAWPALVSTRDNGEPYMGYPLVRQFNYVVTALEQDGGYELLDPTDPLRPPGLLAPRALAQYAWVVRGEESEWTQIPADQSTSTLCEVTARLDPQGRASGRVSHMATGYSALEQRQAWNQVSADSAKCRQHLVETLLPDHAEATIARYELSGVDSLAQPLGVLAGFSELEAGVPAGRQLVLKPFFLAGMSRNPFVHETRKYPVDFPHSIREHYRLELELPAGWKCPTLPADVADALPERAGTLTRRYRLEGTKLIYERDLMIQRLRFDVPEYRRLRGFFDRVAETAGEELLLAEEATPAAAAAPARGGRQ